MNLSQTKEVINFLWKVRREGKIKNLPTITLVGDTGIGKSTIIEEVLRDYILLNNKSKPKKRPYLEYLFLAQQEVGDLIGMPTMENGKTTWAAPEWFPNENDAGLLTFDELADSDPQTRKAVMPLLLTNKLHQHVLPRDVMVICAMNPVGGAFGGMGFTKQFKNRLLFLKVKPTISEWLTFAEKAGLPAYVKSAVAEQPDFFEDSNDSNQGWESSTEYDGIPSRRAVTTAAFLLEEMTAEELASFGQELLVGVVGPVKAGMLIRYKSMGVEEVMNIQDLFSNPARMLAKIDRWNANNEVPKVAAFNKLFIAMVLANKSVEHLNMDIITQYLEVLPQDIVGGTLKEISANASSPEYKTSFLVEITKRSPEVFKKLHSSLNTTTTATKQVAEVAA